MDHSSWKDDLIMARTLGIDFGANNTVIASCDEESGEVRILHLQDWTKEGPEWIIPSLIHYLPDHGCLYGNEIKVRKLTESPGTIRWMKHYINTGSPVRMTIGGQSIDYRAAGSDFLVPIIKRALQEYQLKRKEVIFTIPEDATDKYLEWIGTVADQANLTRYRLIDDASAAMIGYQIPIRKESVWMIFDFGGSNMEVSVVMPRFEDQETRQICRVLGRATDDVGGSLIDQWFIQEVRKRLRLSHADLTGERSAELLRETCEHVKEELSSKDKVPVRIDDTSVGRLQEITITRPEFEDILNTHGLPTRVNRVIDRALQAAAQRGFSEERMEYILMVGGSSAIPAVQDILHDRFGQDRVFCHHPGSVVARGAAQFMRGQESAEYIQHNYGIRFWNSQTGEYDYRIIVRRGTSIPSSARTARFFIKGTYDGQTRLGISVYEMGTGIQNNSTRELLPDPGGGYHLVEMTPEESVGQANLWVNEHNITFLIASPPAKKGEIRFEVWFDIDGNKRLLLSSRDVKTGRMIMERTPIVQLR
jgi:molecular chaperone DnaK